MSKYDHISQACFGLNYVELDNEQQIVVQNEYESREN